MKCSIKINFRTLWKLFITTLFISSCTFGGGFVIITFMKRKFVDAMHWIDEAEMLDIAALAQVSPGAIAVNAAFEFEHVRVNNPKQMIYLSASSIGKSKRSNL